MSWFRVDDGIAFHRKTLVAGNEALGAWLRAGAWSSAPSNLTDGWISPEAAAQIARPRVWDRLLAAGMLDIPPDGRPGYQIHDYVAYNPTAMKVREDRAAWAERQRRARTSKGSAPPPPDGEESRQEPPVAPPSAESTQLELLGAVVVEAVKATKAKAPATKVSNYEAAKLIFAEYMSARTAWRSAKGKTGGQTPTLTKDYVKLVTARINGGCTIEQLCASARGMFRDTLRGDEYKTFDYAMVPKNIATFGALDEAATAAPTLAPTVMAPPPPRSPSPPPPSPARVFAAMPALPPKSA